MSNRSLTRRPWPSLAVGLSAMLLGAAMAVSGGVAVAQSTGLKGGRIALPDFGDSSATVFSNVDDARLGEAFLREVRASEESLDIPEVDAYVRGLGYRLVEAGAGAGQTFTFIVLKDPVINAFAGPSGVIGLNTGLILSSRTESELAAVLAHEIAHVTQRHLARAFQLQDQTSIPAMAGILAAIILASQSSKGGAAALATVVGTRAQAQIDFTRANEREADRIGIETLIRSDLDPGAMAGFFEQLQTAQQFYRTPPEFLSTHPVTTDRIAEARSRAATQSYRQFEDSAAYGRVKARLYVLVHGPKKALEYFEGRMASGVGRSRQADTYGKALALMGSERWREAEALLAGLTKADPGALSLQDARARSLHRLGRTQEAVAIYRDGLRAYLYDRILTFGLAELQIDAGQPKEAAALMTTYLRHQRPDAAAYRLLALAHDRAGAVVASKAALAEYHYANGQIERAIHQLEQAQRVRGTDYYLAAGIDARLELMRAEQLARAGR